VLNIKQIKMQIKNIAITFLFITCIVLFMGCGKATVNPPLGDIDPPKIEITTPLLNDLKNSESEIHIIGTVVDIKLTSLDVRVVTADSFKTIFSTQPNVKNMNAYIFNERYLYPTHGINVPFKLIVTAIDAANNRASDTTFFTVY
jgi:hypothetical protein